VNISRGRDVEVHVLIRPRGGNFVYSRSDFDIIVRDILAAKSAGADGEK
jgi:copper homeostasis protein